LQDNELEKIAAIYNLSNGKKNFEPYFHTKLASIQICSDCKDKDVLELGCGEGLMTEDLLKITKTLTVVEPTLYFYSMIKKKFGSNVNSNVNIYNCFLHEIENRQRYDILIMASLLQHIKEPEELLELTKGFLRKNGMIIVTVPNVNSLHRQIGVKSGMLKNVTDDTENNKKLAQYRKFDKDLLSQLFITCGFEIVESYGYMFKPFSNEQMEKLNLDWNVIHALNEIGRENQQFANQLYIKAIIR